MPQASSRETVVFASMVGGSLFKKLLWRAGTCGLFLAFLLLSCLVHLSHMISQEAAATV